MLFTVLENFPWPSARLTFPLKPFCLFFFVLILMIPALPDASYFDGGLSMISIWSTWAAVIPLSRLLRSLPESCEGLPSIMMSTPCFPFRLIFPFLSKVTPGDFSSTSINVAPVLVKAASTLTTVLSGNN